jgi:DNA mismatch endonuclease, patch repair protein
MADVFSKQKRSQVMSAIRSKGNKDTELKLVMILRAHAIKGWRRHRPLRGNPDFIVPKHRLALFVDGCFWHGCKKHGRQPSSDQDYWLTKFRRNKIRDMEVTLYLRKNGWSVVRVWEHELMQPAKAAKRIKCHLQKTPRVVQWRKT